MAEAAAARRFRARGRRLPATGLAAFDRFEMGISGLGANPGNSCDANSVISESRRENFNFV
jgi:hypothetical protein